MNKQDNVVFILQKAIKRFRIRVTNNSVKEFLMAHPHYPSLKSVCDALRKWKVEHYALNLEQEEIKALERPFIAHLKTSGGKFVFVDKIKNERVTYYLSERRKITEKFERFAEKLSGAVVVMEGNKFSGEKEYSHIRQNEFLHKSLLPVGVTAILVLCILNFAIGGGSVFVSVGGRFSALFFTKIIGLSASIFLVLHELKIHTSISDKICGFSSKIDCDSVLLSNASKFFGWLNWADAGLVFFTGSLIFLFRTPGNNSLWLLAMLSALSLPYPVFSIYYQWVVLKKWCTFCLMVQVVLIAEFILLFPALKSINFSGIELLHLVVSFLVPASIWLIFRALYNKSAQLKKEHNALLQFNRNRGIFKYLLQSKGYVEFEENENSLILGNPNAEVTFTVFLSLYCNPCATAFNKLKTMLDDCKDVKVNAIFSIYDDEESQELIDSLYLIYAEKGSSGIIKFLDKWYSTAKNKRKQLYGSLPPGNFELSGQIADENKELFKRYKIAGTPTVYVNGFKYPGQYKYSEVEQYIEDIKELTTESKRQEACTACN